MRKELLKKISVYIKKIKNLIYERKLDIKKFKSLIETFTIAQ